MALVKGTDTFALVAEADARIAAFCPHDTTWAARLEAFKEGCLRAATRDVCDGFVWNGFRTKPHQDLDFPRDGLLDRDQQRIMDRDIIPEELTWATIEQARLYASKDRQKDDAIETIGVASVAGTASFSGAGGRKVLGDKVWDLIPSHWYQAERRRPRLGQEVKVVDAYRG